MGDLSQLKTHIGQLLKELRVSQKLTIQDAALGLDMAFPNYLYLEKGQKGAPKLETLFKLAEFYGVPLDYFFKDFDKPHKKNLTELKLLTEFRKLNPEKRNISLRLLRALRAG
ncbi:putative XRE family transcriptional regulators [Candidatus Termititenax aidoneus]|uniref:XRE family transcriptional regulators n=1 Tax=Termititenax aidoneus TaxID=2218524 RepID=A0A388T9U1_TERA1|nr:putative XRE family transcriptional regulators [Candidatus Termititenax aidoneus]